MKQIFGMAFVRQFGETPQRLWVEAIDELTDDECRSALTRLRRRGGAFPCNLGEFVEMCGRGNRHGPRYLGVPTDPAHRLAPPRARREHVDACLARMRSTAPAPPAPADAADPAPAELERDPRLAAGCTCAPDNTPCPHCRAWHERLSS